MSAEVEQAPAASSRLVFGSDGAAIDLNNLPPQPTAEQMAALVNYITSLENAVNRKSEEEAKQAQPAVQEEVPAPSQKRGQKRKAADDDEGSAFDDAGEESDNFVDEAEKRPKKKPKTKEASAPTKARGTWLSPGQSQALGLVKTQVPTKVPQKILKAKLKSLLAHLKSKVKAEKFFSGYDSTTRELTAEEVFTQEEFTATFQDFGTQTQPTPENNPKSTVIIRDLSGSDLEKIFGADTLAGLKCTVWAKGGKPTYGGGFFGFGRGGGFSKGRRIGAAHLKLLHAKLTYSTNNLKVALKVACINEGASGSGDGLGW